jgi:hypothetical protein
MKNFFYNFYKPFLSSGHKDKKPKYIYSNFILLKPHPFVPKIIKANLEETLKTVFSSKYTSIEYKNTKINKDIYFYHYDLDVSSRQIYKPNFIANCLSRLNNQDYTLPNVYYGPVLVVSSLVFENSITSSGKDIYNHINHFPSEITHQIYKIYEYTQNF